MIDVVLLPNMKDYEASKRTVLTFVYISCGDAESGGGDVDIPAETVETVHAAH